MSRDELKILVLSDVVSFHTERYIGELIKQNCRTLLLSLESGTLDYVKLKKRGSLRQLHYLLCVSEIKKIISDFQPDVISAHFASGYGFTAALANRIYKLPLVVNVWGSDILVVPGKSFLHRWKTAYALKKADHVFGDSHYLVDKASQVAPLKSSSVVPWGIEEEYLSLHKKDYTLSTPTRIIVPRHHEPVYNNLFILDALAPLINENKIELTFPAFGSLFQAFREQAILKTGDKVKFYDKLSRDDFLIFLSRHDIYLSASLSDSSPVSLIEAMALGLIPVVARIDGVREWLSEKNGFLFNQNDKESLAGCINGILKSNDVYESLRAENLKRVKDNAVFESNISHQIAIMKKLAAMKGGDFG